MTRVPWRAPENNGGVTKVPDEPFFAQLWRLGLKKSGENAVCEKTTGKKGKND